MADQGLNKEEYDEIERVLAARPVLRASRQTRANVMARIANMPQMQVAPTVIESAVARYAVPVVTYPAPLEAIDAALAALQTDPTERQQRRLLAGFIFTGMWAGASLLVVWLLWPAIYNLIFGPSNDQNMQDRLVALQNFWSGLTSSIGHFVTDNGTTLPAMLSAAVGLALMLFFLYGPTQRRRLTTR